MILFFDTETTGLYSDRVPLDHPSQPHIVQIAMMLTDDAGSPISTLSMVVNPECPIPPGATAVHGISDDLARGVGISEKTAAGLFRHMSSRAKLIVAHNAKFDIGVMLSACAREGMRHRGDLPAFCTMEAASPIVNLPPTERMLAAGFDKPKPPKLEECIAHFFGETLDGAHDALVDVQACARVFFHLKSLEN